MSRDTQDKTDDNSTSALTWHLDSVSFNDALIELLGRSNTVLPRAAMDEIARDLIALIADCDEERASDVTQMLDRLTVIGASSLRFRYTDLFDSFVRTSLNIYLSGFDENGDARRKVTGKGIVGPALWLHVITRIFAVGAYAVRLEEWAAVRKLAVQAFPEIPYRSVGEEQRWLRHALTNASRERLLDLSVPGVVKGGELIPAVQKIIDAEPALRCDLPQGDVRLLNSILQFDMLALVAVSADLGAYNTSYVYPSAAAWRLRRVEPVVIKLLLDAGMKEALAGEDLDEKLLADILRGVQEYALRLNFSHEMGWSSQQLREMSRRPSE